MTRRAAGFPALVVLFLALSVAAVYGRSAGHGFITFDDDQYVVSNPVVQRGLTAEGVAWAFTSTHATNWHPLTWLSHMADAELFGMWAGGHHLMSVLLHAANAVLLFFALRSLTGAPGRSAFVAALFALHPLHVESVAWVSERKDLLSGMFWILSMWAYGSFAARGGAWRYLLTAACLALSLLSKPMAVTLPFVFLLLDFWPLRRFGAVPLPRLLLEKAPFLALALASCVVTVLAQKGGGAMGSLELLPPGARLANAAVSYVAYMGKTLWPAGLSAFYPHPWAAGMPGLPAWRWGAAALLLAVFTALALRGARERPYLATGWLWFLGTLVPVIGIVQAGEQGMADRYTYLPLTGLFLVLAWGIPDLLGERPWRRAALGAAAGAVLALLALLSFRQAGLWRDTVTLFRHAVAVTEKNWMAHSVLGYALEKEGRTQEALESLRVSVLIQPNFMKTRYNLGNALRARGDFDGAILHFRAAIRLSPYPYSEAHNNLGSALVMRYLRTGQGSLDEGEREVAEALRINPGNEEARYNMEMVRRFRLADSGPSARGKR